MIRLKRFGIKNKPQYKLIVQGHYKRLKGRYVEHLGYWFPVKLNEHDRSIVLNKGRLRYWISVGAVHSPKVQKLLSFADIATTPWTSFGTQTLYKRNGEQKKRLDEGIKKFIDNAGKDSHADRYARKIRAHDEENLLLRRVKFGRALGQFVNEKEEIIEDNGVAEDDIQVRTEKFLRLKKIYDEIEAKDPLLSPLKREMLYRKMNELASLGLIVENEQKEISSTPDDAIASLYEQRKVKAYNTLTGAIDLFQPITKEEFISVAKLHMLVEDYEGPLDELFQRKTKSGLPLTKADLHIFCKIFTIENDNEVLSKSEIRRIEQEMVAPTKYPLTPFPDPNDYDPEDWFDVGDDNNFNITHNYKGEDKWFDLPLTKRKQDNFKNMREKQFRDFITVRSPLKHK